MKNPPKLQKRWSKRNLPDDLWPEILSRLPIKPLLRFRCVSKSWLSLIHNPDFARLHLSHSNNHHHRPVTHLLFLRESPGLEFSLRCSKTLRITTKLLLYQPTLPSSTHNWMVVSSIDGLFILKRNIFQHWHDYIYMLLNPSIRKTQILPSPFPEIPNEMKSLDFGLGFDPLKKDYKHVRLVLTRRTNSPQSVAVYSVGTSSWKTIEFQADGCPKKWRKGFHYNDGKHVALCFGGVLFSLATVGDSVVAEELVSFDLSSEVFSSTKLPVEDDTSSEFAPSLSMADGGSSLVVVNISDKGTGSIWVLEGLGADAESRSWSKRHSFVSMIPRHDAGAGAGWFFYLGNNGEMLLRWSRMVTSYNLETHKEIILRKDFYGGRKALPYKESLLLL